MCKSENVQQHLLNYVRSTDLSVKLFHHSRVRLRSHKTIEMQKSHENGATLFTVAHEQLYQDNKSDIVVQK